MKKRLLVVGGGDFAREVLWAAQDVPPDARDWEPAGFLDDNPEGASERLAASGVALPVLGTIAAHEPTEDCVYISGIGSPRAKLATCELLQGRGARFVNVIHPTAVVGPGAVLGHGVLLWRQALVSVNARVGDHVTLQYCAAVGHDAELGEGCTLSAYAEVTGHVRAGRGVFLGSHAVVLPGKQVGELATVGAGSVVVRHVPAGVTVFGSPAKRLSS